MDPCGSSLSAATGTADVTLAYEAGSTAESISPDSSTSTWDPDTVFSSIAGCPVTSCNLYNSGCTTLFSGSDVTLSLTSITAVKTNTAGYNYPLCIRCTNGSDTQDLDNWRVI